MSSIKERIKEIAVNKGIPLGKFFKNLDLAPSGFNGDKIKKGANSDTIEKIVSLFPDVDLYWLITGKAAQQEENPQTVMNEPPEEYGNNYKDKYIEILEENRALQKKVINLLEVNGSLKKDNQPISNK